MFRSTFNLVSLLLIISLMIMVSCYAELGSPCDPNFYNKIVRPSSDAMDDLYKLFGTPSQTNAAMEFGTKTQQMEKDIDELIKSHTGTSEDKKREKTILLDTKGCSGLASPYLTCHSTHQICVCKNAFPFNNIEHEKQCFGQEGAICSLSYGFQIQCSGGLKCEEGGIRSIHFCGGVEEFRKAQQIENGGSNTQFRNYKEYL